jgi:hypothetical protein
MDPQRAAVARMVLRLVLYGLLGVFFEVASFPLARLGRSIPVVDHLFAFDIRPDARLALDNIWHTPVVTLFGQTSLWMVPIYAFAALCIEMLYRKALFRKSWIIRAFVYGCVILAVELIAGFAVKSLTGYAIWMYCDRGNILQMTSLYVLPVWMFVGLGVELLSRELMEPHFRAALEQEYSQSLDRHHDHFSSDVSGSSSAPI